MSSAPRPKPSQPASEQQTSYGTYEKAEAKAFLADAELIHDYTNGYDFVTTTVAQYQKPDGSIWVESEDKNPKNPDVEDYSLRMALRADVPVGAEGAASEDVAIHVSDPRIHQGTYVTLEIREGGPLVIRPTKAFFEDAADIFAEAQKPGPNRALYHLFEDFLCNGWSEVRDDESFSMTPYGGGTLDNGNEAYAPIFFSHDRAIYDNPLEKLVEDGELVFERHYPADWMDEADVKEWRLEDYLQHDGLESWVIKSGSKVKSYDFPDNLLLDPARAERNFIEGHVTAFVQKEGCMRYEIKKTRVVSGGEDVPVDPNNAYAYPPLNGTPMARVNATCAGVIKLPDFPPALEAPVPSSHLRVLDRGEVTVIKGEIMLELEDIGEGLEGDYDEEDPDDVPLLRFTALKFDPMTDDWTPLDDASYCTRIPATIPREQQVELAKQLMGEIHKPASEGHSIKKLCERLSWIDEKGSYC